jgi:hypothetical protein
MLFQASSVRCSAPECSAGEPVGSDLIRAEIRPMEEAQGFRALLNIEEPKYSIEQIAARVGKTPAFVAALCGQPHKAAYVALLLM